MDHNEEKINLSKLLNIVGMMEQITPNNPPIIIHNINPPILNPKFLPLILFSLLNLL